MEISFRLSTRLTVNRLDKWEKRQYGLNVLILVKAWADARIDSEILAEQMS